MGQKGYEVLRLLSAKAPELVEIVVSAPDPGVQNDFFVEIREHCAVHQIKFAARGEDFDINAQYVFAVSWRWLIKADNSRVIVFHDALLPRYRGFNPLVSCLINGEPEIGVTALYASVEYDRGDIIARVSTRITYPIKIQEAIELVIHSYLALAGSLVQTIANCAEIQGQAQNEELASYSLWRDDNDYQVDWTRSAVQISRFVDAVGFPYRGAYTMVNDRPARLLDADALHDVNIENRSPGKVLFIRGEYPIVVCGEGLLRIRTLVDDETGQSLLPLAKFRSRFT
jgi:methionyl-tRNA formyltransferase